MGGWEKWLGENNGWVGTVVGWVSEMVAYRRWLGLRTGLGTAQERLEKRLWPAAVGVSHALSSGTAAVVS